MSDTEHRHVDPIVQVLHAAHTATGQRLTDLGAKAGMTRHQISRAFAGERSPTLRNLRALADALEVPLYAGDPPDDARTAIVERLEAELGRLRNNANDDLIDARARNRELEKALAAKDRELAAVHAEQERLAARVEDAERARRDAEKHVASLQAATADPRFLRRLSDGLNALARTPPEQIDHDLIDRFRNAVRGTGTPPLVTHHWAAHH